MAIMRVHGIWARLCTTLLGTQSHLNIATNSESLGPCIQIEFILTKKRLRYPLLLKHPKCVALYIILIGVRVLSEHIGCMNTQSTHRAQQRIQMTSIERAAHITPLLCPIGLPMDDANAPNGLLYRLFSCSVRTLEVIVERMA